MNEEKGISYTCYRCKRDCIAPNSYDEAVEAAVSEYVAHFGKHPDEPLAFLCDDCHKRYVVWARKNIKGFRG